MTVLLKHQASPKAKIMCKWNKIATNDLGH